MVEPARPDDGLPVLGSVEELYDPTRFERNVRDKYRHEVTVRGLPGVKKLISEVAEQRDCATGRAFFTKYCCDPRDLENEVIVSRLARERHQPYPAVRYAVPGENLWVLVQHGATMPGVGRLLGDAHSVYGMAHEWPSGQESVIARQLQDSRQALQLTLDDVMVGAIDRHEGNWLLGTAVDNEQALRIIPIDHALSLAPEDIASLRSYLSYGNGLADVALASVQDGLVRPGEVAAIYDQHVADWQRVIDRQWGDLARDLERQGLDPATTCEIRELLDEQLVRFTEDRAVNLEELTTRPPRSREEREERMALFEAFADGPPGTQAQGRAVESEQERELDREAVELLRERLRERTSA